jgi:myosin heavy subunit
MIQHECMQYLEVNRSQQAKDQGKEFDGKSWCWIPTKDGDAGYIAAKIKSSTDDMATVETSNGKVLDIKKELCDQMNPPKYEKCSDMASLTYLNEASVLYNLKERYEAGLIYTYSGLFCIAVNPYRRLPIYTDDVVKLYRGKRRPEMPPHVFSLVDVAYQDMLAEHENQSMLITGESGAGKTENTKKVIQYIAKVAGVEKKKDEAVGGLKGDLDEQVVAANPLLEAFGNAKTTRNNNSSRFGKFIRCHFGPNGKLAGADIESYLLEKNRVCSQGSAERNYHIFYQLLYATSDEELTKYCLPTRTAHDYAFLKDGVATADKIDDFAEFKHTCNAIKILGFTEDENTSMFKICSAILNFGNIKFKQKPRDEQAEVVDPADGERVGYLLGIAVGEFHKSLIKPKVKVGTEFVNKGQSVSQVLYAVGALSKALYERMFLWMVQRVNKALDTKERRSYFIGVLDIAGFEIFDYNSFEQLCINLTNEKLQQFFNHHMFVLEQEEYKKEGIAWEFIDFGMDLEVTIDLVEKPMGIFAMLEEECIVPKATDQTYLAKLHKQHANNKSYGKPTAKQSKTGMGDFILKHYAGAVGYSVAHWLEKNKDPINEHTAQLFSKATDPLVSTLFVDYNPDLTGGRRKGSAFMTVSYRHKEQLKSLIGTLMQTAPHFVRCIIPNEQKTPGLIEGNLILHQLRCNGVLEGIRICRKGFPSRMNFTDFRQRYQILAANAIPPGFIDGKVAAEKLIEALQFDTNEYKVGTTKVFFRAGIVGELEEMRDERLSKIISQFQAYCKGHLMRIEYKKMLEKRVGLAVIQRNVRKFLFLRNWSWWKLYIQVQPLLSIARAEDDMKEKEEAMLKAQEDAKFQEEARKKMEIQLTDAVTEKEKLYSELQAETDRLIAAEDKLMQTQSLKDKLEASLNEALEKLEGEEHSVSVMDEKLQDLEDDVSDLRANADEMQTNISRLEGEKSSRDKQINTLNEDLANQDEALDKLNKDKANLDEHLQERTEQLQTAEDKVNALNKAKNKLEASMKDGDHALKKERDAKAKVEKEKRKVEGDLKEARDHMTELDMELKSTQDTVAKRDKAIKELQDSKEGQDNAIKALQKKIQELLARIEELEDELENERKLRQKSEAARKDLEAQIEELQDQVELAGGATNAQLEVSKKRENEVARLRKELEDTNAANSADAASIKAKLNASLQDAQDEIEVVKKAKAKSDKDKQALATEVEELTEELNKIKKQKQNADKSNRSNEDKVREFKAKVQSLEEKISEGSNKGSASDGEYQAIQKSLAEAEHKLGLASKAKQLLEASLADAEEQCVKESKGKHDNHNKLQNALADLEQLQDQLEDEQTIRQDLQNKYSRANADSQQWKNKYETEGASRVDELDDAKKKLANRVQDMEEALASAESKTLNMEKLKVRMSDEVDDLLLDLEKAQSQASNLEKKQKKVDQQINEWKLKCEEIQADLDKSQKDVRQHSTELLKIRSSNEDNLEKYESIKRENKALSAELSLINEQLSDGGKSSAEIEKVRRKLGMENEELQIALEEAEVALEHEEAKFLKVQLELTSFRQSHERKNVEREEEVEAIRKNHQRQVEALQSTIDSESKSKLDSNKLRKQYESEMNDFESKLEKANRIAAESQKNSKRMQAQIKELQNAVDDEQRGREEIRDSAIRSERRANDLSVQLDETKAFFEQSERSRKLAEVDRSDKTDRLAELQSLYNNVVNNKRKAEGDFHALQDEIEDLESEARAAEEKAQRAMAEVARLMAELSKSQDSSSSAEKSRQLLSKQVVDLQAKLEEANQNSGKGLKGQIRKLEITIGELENDLDAEARKGGEAMKIARRNEKKAKEQQFQLEDEQKAVERAQDAADKLNAKVKKQRMQVEEAEQQNSMLTSKLKKAIVDLENAEERGEQAESALQRARQKARGATASGTRAPTAGGTRMGSTSVSRARSRARSPQHDD